MPNLHPPLSSFPAALLTLLIVIEIIRAVRPSSKLWAASEVVAVASLVAVVAAFFSGYHGYEFAQAAFSVPEETIASHHVWGRSALIAILVSVPLKFIAERAAHGRKIFAGLYALLLAVSFGFVAMTGYLGGELVFTYGAGVTSRPSTPATSELPLPDPRETPFPLPTP